jgi:hypothetical protein
VRVILALSSILASCADDARRGLGETCGESADCASGLCVEQHCLDPNADNDQDTLLNAREAQLGSSPASADTDGDGKRDPDELDPTHTTAPDTDGDGKADVIESVNADADRDCLADELDARDAQQDPPGCGTGPDDVPWQIFFDPNIDVSACGDRPVSWCCQNIQVDAQGRFDQSWAPNEPNTARISGTLESGGFSATLACLPDAVPTGTLVGEKVGDHYVGTFTFQQQSGAVLVVRWTDEVITMQGRVTAQGSGAPVAGARVTGSVDAAAAATSDPHGRFFLMTSAPARGANNAWTLSITAAGYADWQQTHVWGDRAQQQSFSLVPAPP